MRCVFFFFQAEDGIRDQPRSRGLGDVYKRQFIEAAEEDKEPMWLSFFVTLIDCGLRVGEAMALRWSDIDFNKNTLSVNATRIYRACLLYTSDAADDTPCVDFGGRRIIKKKKTNKIRL
ncbi:Integrase family protein [Lactobacillus casei W56] [Lacticaseibacillus rhamnosus]|nr:Integrase family protein [Lactobacillus casei W56] [Lacticaseibacillus rhamnosus]